MNKFEVISEFSPKGDQPNAIKELKNGIASGNTFQTLKGITGSGKSATIAWLIEQTQLPSLVLAPNKALAAQLANEFKQFFPNNRVEYFVSYYDYYQPEAYVPRSDTFIEKDATINEEIDRLRHSATSALLLRDDVIVVSSVSCIYGLGSPIEYKNKLIPIIKGEVFDIEELLIARQTELAKLDEMNIITDSDPSATNKSGGSQYKPINTVDPFGDTDAPTGEDAENVAEGSDGSY